MSKDYNQLPHTSIKQLRGKGLIVEVNRPDDTRWRYYKLSGTGPRC